MAVPTIRAYDVVIDDGTTPLGFMLARNSRRGGKALRYGDAQTLPPIVSQEALSESKTPPALELTLTQNDWRGGIGGFRAIDHPNRYFRSLLGVDATTEGVIKLAPEDTASGQDTAPLTTLQDTAIFLWGTEFWATRGRQFYNWDFATDKRWELVTPGHVLSADDVYRSPTYYAGVVYLARHTVATWGDTNTRAYVYKSTAGTGSWTASTLTPSGFMCFAAADGKLWGGNRSGGKHQVYSSTDGTNAGSWTGPTSVGDSNFGINALLDYNGILLICKEEGLFTVDASGTVTTLLSVPQEPDNFKNAIMWGKRAILPNGNGNLWILEEDGSISDNSLRLVSPQDSRIQGRVVNLASTPERLYALVWDDTNDFLYLVFADNVEMADGAKLRWHILRRWAENTTRGWVYQNSIYVQSFYNSGTTEYYQRVWVGQSSLTSQTLSTPGFIPTTSNDKDWAYDATVEELDTVDEDGGYTEVTKSWRDVRVRTQNLGTGAGAHTIPTDYSTDKGSTWTSLGTFNADNQTISFPAGTTGKTMRLRFKLTRGTTTTTTPELNSFTITGQLRPSAVKLHQYAFYVADGQWNLANGFMRNADQQVSQLRTWNTQAASVTVYDDARPAGLRMVSLPGTMQEDILAQGRGRRAERRVSMAFVEVA